MKDTIRNWLTEQFGADDALHAELYAQYAADMKARASTLAAALAQRDVAQLAATGHAMKGMALQMGDRENADPCLTLQKAGEAGDLDACAAILPAIAATVAAL